MERRKELNWKRTGKTHVELSENAGGEILYAEEKAGRKTRNVQIEYKSFSKDKQKDILLRLKNKKK